MFNNMLEEKISLLRTSFNFILFLTAVEIESEWKAAVT